MTVSRKIKVYRVEHKETGEGPYRAWDNTQPELAMCYAHAELGHPPPTHDGIETMERTDYCGFASREALDKWFHGWKTKLHKWGYHITVYDVPLELVKFGRTQVVFERDADQWFDRMRILR